MEARQPAAVPDVFLLPGEVHVASRPSRVITVLGSCVAVCLWDERLAQGGMNHFVLPDAGLKTNDPRYGGAAMSVLVDGIVALGSHRRNLVAKIFGGAAVLGGASSFHDIGARNAAAARQRLHQEGIRVAGGRTGGQCGVVIRFYTATGAVDLRQVPVGPWWAGAIAADELRSGGNRAQLEDDHVA